MNTTSLDDFDILDSTAPTYRSSSACNRILGIFTPTHSIIHSHRRGIQDGCLDFAALLVRVEPTASWPTPAWLGWNLSLRQLSSHPLLRSLSLLSSAGHHVDPSTPALAAGPDALATRPDALAARPDAFTDGRRGTHPSCIDTFLRLAGPNCLLSPNRLAHIAPAV